MHNVSFILKKGYNTWSFPGIYLKLGSARQGPESCRRASPSLQRILQIREVQPLFTGCESTAAYGIIIFLTYSG